MHSPQTRFTREGESDRDGDRRAHAQMCRCTDTYRGAADVQTHSSAAVQCSSAAGGGLGTVAINALFEYGIHRLGWQVTERLQALSFAVILSLSVLGFWWAMSSERQSSDSESSRSLTREKCTSMLKEPRIFSFSRFSSIESFSVSTSTQHMPLNIASRLNLVEPSALTGFATSPAGSRICPGQRGPPTLLHRFHGSLHPPGLLCTGDLRLQRCPDTDVQFGHREYCWAAMLRPTGGLLPGK